MSWTPTITVFAWLLASLAGVGACGPSDDAEPFFPADYMTAYQEVRDCRRSPDHDLNYIRVLASPEAQIPYQSRQEPFPAGAVVLKAEYADAACTDIAGFTVMRKEAGGSAPDMGDWSWQRVSAGRAVQPTDELRCMSCHQSCGTPPDGYDLTCAAP